MRKSHSMGKFLLVFAAVVFSQLAFEQTSYSFGIPDLSKLEEAQSRYQEIAQKGGWPKIPSGPKMEMGKQDSRIPLLRERLAATGDLSGSKKTSDILFDQGLETAVRLFQKRHGLTPDGAVGVWTLQALNVSVQKRIRQITATLKRLSAFSKDLEKKYILVNIPDFSLFVVDNGQLIMTTRVIVGMPTWPTPIFSGKMTYLVFNPLWYIPSKILLKETASKVHENPNYLSEQGIKIFEKKDSKLEAVDPEKINWSEEAIINYQFRQEAGPFNPLGNIKFMFPNKYEVYLHDTPSKNLFERTSRTFSHGCVRLEKAVDLAAYLLKDNPEWDHSHIMGVLGKKSGVTVLLSQPVDIHLVYWTAWVDDEGLVQFRSDIYKMD